MQLSRYRVVLVSRMGCWNGTSLMFRRRVLPIALIRRVHSGRKRACAKKRVLQSSNGDGGGAALDANDFIRYSSDGTVWWRSCTGISGSPAVIAGPGAGPPRLVLWSAKNGMHRVGLGENPTLRTPFCCHFLDAN